MLPTAGVPFLTHLISRIRDAGVSHVVLGTSYRAEVFEEYFGDGTALGVELDYVVETEALGTGGGIRNVAPALRGDTILVFNGDVLSGADLPSLLEAHHAKDADVTLYLTKVEDPRAFGCVPTDDEGRVVEFLEKDPHPRTDQINAGIYVFKRPVIDSIPTGRPVSVERETFPALLRDGARVFGHVDSGYWRDLGTPSDFVSGSADLVLGVAPSPAVPGSTGQALVLDGSSIAASAVLSGGTTIGAGCTVGSEATVEGSVVFDGALIGDGALVRRSVVGFGASIGAGAVVEDSIIGDRAIIGVSVELRFGARIWPDAVLADGSVRFSSDL
jgi:mannose-1-phosphate guanylyltransferase